ncbi:hypothetical protein GL50803_00104232 [Giardia duodenalis]|uniref:Uncharacterized protein n=1 Tax=Giardia intestinalis (strain ATCC 50803 / WB clone C6) TaxID=184922 RepID=A8BV22_GIAIC|nr:hypothetical protein GL50803_00104232 [Giardia intestinalis]KAE8304524.1 hypothetical protein GL50803_00104232 [Giardia intestinalis]|eukprot:XP_001704706.1 Hypothetical protein GL50803_104232 [Giardia lamblia ATCC 50803]
MLASSLRSLMANYHATGGVVQDAELLALSDGLLEDARRSPASCAFAASLATRTAGEGPERLERIVLLSDLQLGVEQSYVLWILDLQPESSECVLNWPTTRLLLCLVCAHLLDATTFGAALAELCVIGGVDTVRDVLTAPLGTGAAPFLSVYACGTALLCMLLGFGKGCGDPFSACLPLLEILRADACAFTAHRAASSANPRLPPTDPAAFPRLLTASDTFQVLLTCRRARKLAGADSLMCRLSDVQAVTDRINGVATMELRGATALVGLFSTCIAPDSLAALVANRGSHFCRLAAGLGPPNQIEEQWFGSVFEVLLFLHFLCAQVTRWFLPELQGAVNVFERSRRLIATSQSDPNYATVGRCERQGNGASIMFRWRADESSSSLLIWSSIQLRTGLSTGGRLLSPEGVNRLTKLKEILAEAEQAF